MKATLVPLALCLALGTALHAQGPGDLSITPARVVLDGRARSAEVALINRSSRAATYRIGFVQVRMAEDGQFEEISEAGPGERFADGLIRFSPRQVTLEPEVAQTVRLMLRKPAGLPPGEYRSHLLFYAVPAGAQAGADIEGGGPGKGQVGVRLTPVYRVSIPVIVREGDLAAGAALSDVAVQPREGAPPVLSFRLRRNGERSLYGDVTATFLPRGGGEVVVGKVHGLAVYLPNGSRTMGLELHPPDGVSLAQGVLRVTFEERPAAPGAARAEAEVVLP